MDWGIPIMHFGEVVLRVGSCAGMMRHVRSREGKPTSDELPLETRSFITSNDVLEQRMGHHNLPARLLTIPEVAELCHLSERSVNRAILDRELRATKLRSRWRIHPDDLAACVNASTPDKVGFRLGWLCRYQLWTATVAVRLWSVEPLLPPACAGAPTAFVATRSPSTGGCHAWNS